MSFAKFNFSPICSRDEIGYLSSRPAYSKENEKEGAVKEEEVDEWIAFMKENKITRIVSFLGDDEVKWYPFDLDEKMRNNFKDYTRTSVFAENSYSIACEAFKRIWEGGEEGERMVVHCSGGSGRAGLGGGVWVMEKYGVSEEEAVEEVMNTGRKYEGIHRRGDSAKLATFKKNKTLKK